MSSGLTGEAAAQAFFFFFLNLLHHVESVQLKRKKNQEEHVQS